MPIQNSVCKQLRERRFVHHRGKKSKLWTLPLEKSDYKITELVFPVNADLIKMTKIC